jgi:hypothetical protein
MTQTLIPFFPLFHANEDPQPFIFYLLVLSSLMFTDLFYPAHINSINNNIAKLYPSLENLVRSPSVIVKILLFLGRRVYSKYLFICYLGFGLYSFNTLM